MAEHETTATLADNQSSKKMNPKRKELLTILAVVFLGIGILWFLYWIIWGRFDIYTDDAYVNGNMVQLMSQVPGTITSINTDDTLLVKAGQLLVKLDEADMAVALQKARANLAKTVRQVRQLYERAEEARAALVLRQADLVQAKLDLKRRIGLVGERAISKEEMQHYTTALETARARYDSALHQLTSSTALVENSHLYEHPLVESAKANFKTAYLNWVRTSIYAPATGYIAKRSVQVGQQINLGSALLAVVPLNQIWVDANYKENQLYRLRVGQDVELTADANDFTYHGKVMGLGAGTGSAFALLPPQNATGNWIKIVQRLPVRIVLDKDEVAAHPLQLGLSMRVTVYTRGLKGDILSKTINNKPVYATTIYDDQLAHADQEIHTILTMNAPDVQLHQLLPAGVKISG